MDAIKQLFSPPVITALRYALTAIGPLLAVVGIVALSPTQIDKIISLAQQVGTAIAAITAFVGVVGPILAGIYGSLSSTQGNRIAAVTAIANDPTQPASEAAKQALVAATISLPEVKTIVADASLATSAPSDDVVPTEAVTVISNTSGETFTQGVTADAHA